MLNPLELQALFQEVDAQNIPAAAKRQLKDMFSAAANPHSERPDVVLKTLTRKRQSNAALLQQQISEVVSGAVQRGGHALLTMNSEEWDRLVEEAHADHSTQ